YPVETHRVVTQDGYILGLHRIPYSPLRSAKSNASRPVFLLLHGILMSSDCWVISGPSRGLPFQLADAGFDVWLANSRGNRYSRRHQRLDPNGKEFWQYSYHEMGIYDLPSTIDYILRLTHRTGLHFVGHSQGCTAFLVMLSQRPEYGGKIVTSHLLAPVALQSRVPSFLGKELLSGMIHFPDMEVPASHPIMQQIQYWACSISWMQQVCKNILFGIVGGASRHLDNSLVPVIMSIVPAGISSRQLRHFASNIQSHRFAFFDFGALENERIYGSQEPPEYPLLNVSTLHPIDLYYADNDGWLDVKDVMKLMGMLPLSRAHRMSDSDWNHIDFIFADKTKACVNDLIIQIARKAE
ncbi:hypothetical protein KR018_009740, partial [Drosophila ironensis]